MVLYKDYCVIRPPIATVSNKVICTFCLVRPTWKFSGSDKFRALNKPHVLFIIILGCLQVHREPPPLFCMCIYALLQSTGLHRATPTIELLLQDFRSVTLVVYQLHVSMSNYSLYLGFYRATPIFTKMPVNSTPTYLLIYQIVIVSKRSYVLTSIYNLSLALILSNSGQLGQVSKLMGHLGSSFQ